jgi:YegS/Rv2252/BmrU family lipid kinase
MSIQSAESTVDLHEPPAEQRRVIAVINPMTRTGVDRIVAAIRRYAPTEVKLDVCFTSPDVTVGAMLGTRLREADLIIACGGDGTVAEVMTAVGDLSTPIGIVPAGSTNVFARENHIPIHPEPAAKLIFGPHQIIRFDIGTCGDRRFLHMGGAGIDSQIFQLTNPAWKHRIGWPAYLPAAAQSLFLRPVEFTITVDETTVKAKSRLVLVANGASIVRSALPLYPNISPEDGLLDVVIITASGPVQVARTLARFASRGLHHSPFVVHLRGRTVRLESVPSISVQIDGDVIGETPAAFGILPRAAHVIAPIR